MNELEEAWLTATRSHFSEGEEPATKTEILKWHRTIKVINKKVFDLGRADDLVCLFQCTNIRTHYTCSSFQYMPYTFKT